MWQSLDVVKHDGLERDLTSSKKKDVQSLCQTNYTYLN